MTYPQLIRVYIYIYIRVVFVSFEGSIIVASIGFEPKLHAVSPTG